MTKNITLLLLILLPCTSFALDDNLRFLIVKRAYDIQDYNLDNGMRNQVNYKIDKVYPDFAITNIEFKNLKTKGWKACEGLPEKWDRYVDITKNSPHSVHQYIKYFAKDNRLLMVAMMYYSSVTNESKCPIKPDNSIQNVIFIDTKYRDRKKNERLLNIKCE